MSEQAGMDLDDRPGRASAPAAGAGAQAKADDNKKPAAKATVPVPVGMSERGLQLSSLDEAMRFCQHVVHAGVAPNGDSPSTVLVKIQAGMELGFTPMRSMTAVYVVNNRTSLMGDAALALIRSKGHRVDVGNRGEGDERCGFMRFHRAGDPAGQWTEVTFTVAEAKVAKLWNKRTSKGGDTPWVTSPDDMLVWRAVARCARRYFSDVLNGLGVYEEVRDYRTLPVADAEVLPTEPDPVLGQLVIAGTVVEASSEQQSAD